MQTTETLETTGPGLAHVGSELPSAISMIEAERKRQVEVEGFDIGHDDEMNDRGELSDAAAAYAAAAGMQVVGAVGPAGVDAQWLWPKSIGWSEGPKVSSDPIRNLVKAGALIVAEIDRLQRSQKTAPRESPAAP